MMPCTWQGGHIITKCTVLSCTDRGLGQYALRFPNPEIVMPERSLGHSYPISFSVRIPGQEVGSFYKKLHGRKVSKNRLTSWRALYTDQPITRLSLCLRRRPLPLPRHPACRKIILDRYSHILKSSSKREDWFERDCGIFSMAWRRDREILIRTWKWEAIRGESDRDEFWRSLGKLRRRETKTMTEKFGKRK